MIGLVWVECKAKCLESCCAMDEHEEKWKLLTSEVERNGWRHEETKWTLGIRLMIRWVNFGKKVNSWPKSTIGKKSFFFNFFVSTLYGHCSMICMNANESS